MFDLFSEENMWVDKNVYHLLLAFIQASVKCWFLFIYLFIYLSEKRNEKKRISGHMRTVKFQISLPAW